MRKVTLSMLAPLFCIALAQETAAQTYVCPSPSSVKCVPADLEIGGWRHNGGQMTGNSFTSNNQCANVISLGGGKERLFCCYKKCGVFIRDVKSSRCSKIGASRFRCN